MSTTLVLLAGCAGGEDSAESEGQDAEQAVRVTADKVAGALSTGDFSDVPLQSGDPSDEYGPLVAGMQGLRPQVTVGEIRRAGTTAVADMDYSWPTPVAWTYESKATLVRDGSKWKLAWDPTVLHPKLTQDTRLERTRTPNDRASILGGDGSVLMENQTVQIVGLNKAKLPPERIRSAAEQIATALNLDAAGYVAKVEQAGPGDFVEATAVSTDDLPTGFADIEGAEQQTVTRPAAATAGYAQALLGTVAPANPDQAAASAGKVFPGDYIGLSGLQQTYDAQLRGGGRNRVFLAARDSEPGVAERTDDTLLADFPPVAGESLRTTIDDAIQTAGEEAVRSAKVPVSVVVIRPETGEILAAADSPAARAGNESTTARWAPGLAYAPVTALAMQRSGIDLGDRVDCPDRVEVAGFTFDNGANADRVSSRPTMARALAEGCRTAVAAAQDRVADDQLPTAAQSLGLGMDHQLGVPVAMGAVPAPKDPLGKADALLGEKPSGVNASALALATVAASVQAERTVTPFLVPGVQPWPDNITPLVNTEAQELQQVMQSGSRRDGGYLTGSVAGTADGREWLLGYNSGRDIAIGVMVADPSGATSVSSVVRQIMTGAQTSASTATAGTPGSPRTRPARTPRARATRPPRTNRTTAPPRGSTGPTTKAPKRTEAPKTTEPAESGATPGRTG